MCFQNVRKQFTVAGSLQEELGYIAEMVWYGKCEFI